MPPNLRSVIERVTRGGRSVVSSRNFSSCSNCGNDSKEAGGRVVAAARLKSSLETRTKDPDLYRCFLGGAVFASFLYIYKIRKEIKASEEEYLRSRREQVLNAEQEDDDRVRLSPKQE